MLAPHTVARTRPSPIVSLFVLGGILTLGCPHTLVAALDLFPDAGVGAILDFGAGAEWQPFSGEVSVDRLPIDGEPGQLFQTEIVSMSLQGEHPTLGPVILTQNVTTPSLGLISEQTPGVDFPVDSFFDVFFEIEIPSLGATATVGNDAAVHVSALLDQLPHGEGDTYRASLPQPLELINKTTGQPSGMTISGLQLTPAPEVDVFSEALARVGLENTSTGDTYTALLSGGISSRVFLEGPLGGAYDDLPLGGGDGLDEVTTELVSMNLTGRNPMVPGGSLSLFGNCSRRSFGQMTEAINNASGTLDVHPFGDGVVDSFFDVFFELGGDFGDGPQLLIAETSKRIDATIATKPPTYEPYQSSSEPVPLRTEGGGGTPWRITTVTVIMDPAFDFGDAPDPVDSTGGEYPTLLANDGARHVVDPYAAPLLLGATVGMEPDGQPTAAADGDDMNVLYDDAIPYPDGDEDGVTFGAPLFVSATESGTGSVTVVVVGEDGLLDAWIDFNQDGDWDDGGEKIFTGEPVANGSNALQFTIPAGASAGNTYARFRLSSIGGLLPTGSAPDGEVEDYVVELLPDPVGTPALTTWGLVALLGALLACLWFRLGRHPLAQAEASS